jgi:hypothetical protein
MRVLREVLIILLSSLFTIFYVNRFSYSLFSTLFARISRKIYPHHYEFYRAIQVFILTYFIVDRPTFDLYSMHTIFYTN